MKTLAERAIVHLLNGDDDKAAALFHKYMVERARQIHESLRQNDGSDELDENWDSEIKEEEYFGDDDLEDQGDDTAMIDAPTDDMGDADVDADVDAEADQNADAHAEIESEVEDDLAVDDGVSDKLDDLTDKIDQLTAEFDRVMSEFSDDDSGMEADDQADDFGDDTLDMGDDATDLGGDETTDGDLADRMDDDLNDEDAPEHEPVAEGDDMGADDMSGDEIDEDDDLRDITESVLAELDKIAAPSNTDGQGVGSNSQPGQKLGSSRVSPVPHHNVMDRLKGAPVMTKGPTHDGFAREASPPVKAPTTVVKDVRKGNRRNSFKDTMGTVPPKGDASAELNKDFAGGPKPTRSIVDGKKKG